MAQKSLRELLDEQKAAKAAQTDPVQPPGSSVPDKPTEAQTSKPVQSGLNLLALIPSGGTQTNSPMLPEVSKAPDPSPGSFLPSVSIAPASAISADEFTHVNQPVLMSGDDEAQLKQTLAFLVSSFSDPDQLRGAIVKIMTDLQDKPQLVDLLYPDDIGTIVRALRESHAVAINVVEEKGSKKRKKAAEVDEFEKMLNGRGGITI